MLSSKRIAQIGRSSAISAGIHAYRLRHPWNFDEVIRQTCIPSVAFSMGIRGSSSFAHHLMAFGLRQSLKNQICSNNMDSNWRKHQCSRHHYAPIFREKAPCHLMGADVGTFQLEYVPTQHSESPSVFYGRTSRKGTCVTGRKILSP